MLEQKIVLQSGGKKHVREMVDAILNTDRTLVTVSYEGYADEIAGTGYTPFGVTRVDENTTIYDMVPIGIAFPEGGVVQTNKVTPVMIDRAKKEIRFAVSTAPADIKYEDVEVVWTDDFALAYCKWKVDIDGNHVRFRLMK